MGGLSWPSEAELDEIRKTVAEMSGRGAEEVRIVVSPYRICPLGAHIDHQGGTVSAMTINKGILLGFVPSNDSQVLIRSGQFKGEVRFRVDEDQLPRNIAKSNGKIQKNHMSFSQEECSWGNYARGALYALRSRGNHLRQGITGFLCGSDGLDSSGLSSSAAVGVAYLLALETANNLTVSPEENIEYDRLIENEYLGLKNGILDQSAILLSSYGCLTCMNCKTKEHKLIQPPKLQSTQKTETKNTYKILLAFSGLKQALTNNPGYNRRVTECQEAANVLLLSSGKQGIEPLLSNVDPEVYEAHKGLDCIKGKPCQFMFEYDNGDGPSLLVILRPSGLLMNQSKLEAHLARRAEHYFTENMRVIKGLEAWALGRLDDFGNLISASGLSSIQNYECGCEPLKQMYDILLRAPGVYGARFSGAGFRGCCIAFMESDRAVEAASFVKNEYRKLQPELATQTNPETAVVICEAGDCAKVI